jgi:hypothetical protein
MTFLSYNLLTIQAKMINIPHLDFKVDKDRWGDPFDLTDKD